MTLLPMTTEPSAAIGATASKSSGSFQWTFSIMATRTAEFPLGAGDHQIDILGLLKVNALSPSPYAFFSGLYTSIVILTVTSNTSVSYVSSQPKLAPSYFESGWSAQTTVPLTYVFGFGSNSSSVSPLTLTFNGVVVPEFHTIAAALVLTLSLLSMTLVSKMKRKHWNEHEHGSH